MDDLRRCKNFLIDCDGVLWRGSRLIEGSDRAISILRKKGYRVAFITNDSTKTRDEFLDKLTQLGFEATLDECFCASFVTAKFLTSVGFTGLAYVIGSEGLAKELSKHGIKVVLSQCSNSTHEAKEPDHKDVAAVVVGLDMAFNYGKLAEATTYLLDESVLFIGTNPDALLPSTSGRLIPCSGPIISAVQTASGRSPVIMGKPSKTLFEQVASHLNQNDPSLICMVGDRMDTDILFGRNGGAKTALVFTGVTDRTHYEQTKAGMSNELLAQPEGFYEADYH